MSVIQVEVGGEIIGGRGWLRVMSWRLSGEAVRWLIGWEEGDCGVEEVMQRKGRQERKAEGVRKKVVWC